MLQQLVSALAKGPVYARRAVDCRMICGITERLLLANGEVCMFGTRIVIISAGTSLACVSLTPALALAFLAVELPAGALRGDEAARGLMVPEALWTSHTAHSHPSEETLE